MAGVIREIGYRGALVFHGLSENGGPGMDEVSSLGPTIFCRLKEDGSLEDGPRLDAVLLNAAPAFLLAGKVADFRAGVELARGLISSGRAMAKLKEWVGHQNLDPAAGLKRLEGVMREAGLP